MKILFSQEDVNNSSEVVLRTLLTDKCSDLNVDEIINKLAEGKLTVTLAIVDPIAIVNASDSLYYPLLNIAQESIKLTINHP